MSKKEKDNNVLEELFVGDEEATILKMGEMLALHDKRIAGLEVGAKEVEEYLKSGTPPFKDRFDRLLGQAMLWHCQRITSDQFAQAFYTIFNKEYKKRCEPFSRVTPESERWLDSLERESPR